jgi:aminopeptidase N
MLSKIAAFELKYQLRAPVFFVGFALFFLLAFGSVTIDEVRIGGRGNVNVNSPFAILQTLAIMSVFGIFLVTAFVANVVIRDDETGFAPIIRATRVTKFDYLIGRFTGALIVAFLALAAVPLGMLIGSWMPWVDSDKLGPFVPGHYLYALFVYALPTLVVVGAGFFALATATRSLMWTYVGAVAFLMLFLMSRLLLRDPAYDNFSALADPFGIGALGLATRYWTASDRNTMLPAIAGLILWNRLLWLGIGFGLLGLAYSLFRFEARGVSSPRQRGPSVFRRKKTLGPPLQGDDGPAPPMQGDDGPVPPMRPLPMPSATPAARWAQLAALTRFDMRTVFKSPAFFVLLAIGIVNAFGAINGTLEIRGTEYFPVTRGIVDVLNGAYTFIPIIIAIYYGGELVWGDRDRRIHEIVGATAAPDWSFMVPKVLAIALVLAATFAAAALTAILFQLAHGYTRLQIEAYLLWFVLPGVVAALLLAVLSVFVQTLVPHKFVGWAVMLVYIVATVTLTNIGFEHNLYNYGGEPNVPLSDMNAMGRFWIARAWFQAYWLAFAVMLLVIAHLMWRRGAETRLRARFNRMLARMRGTAGAVFATAAIAWIALGGWILYNTNVLNEYRTQQQTEKRTAELEKALLQYEKVPQPRITDIKLSVELFPRDVKAVTNGSYVIENRTGQPVPELHVRWAYPLQMLALDIPGAKLKQEFKEFDYRIYTLEPALAPGEKRTITFRTLLEERGFPNARPLTRIVANGTFVRNLELTPFFGMSRDALLQDRAKRRKHGLPPELRLAKLEDASADANHYLRHDTDFVNAELTVTTDADQVPVAPGYLVSDTLIDTPQGKRRQIVTKTDAPIHNYFSMQSGYYAIKTDRWTGKDRNGVEKSVDLAVYYHPEHPYNVQRMIDAMKVSLEMFSERFSPYQFKQARILEFPAYASFAEAFAGTVPYSESIGFIQNHRESKNDEKIDLVTYVTAHEIAHQWWAHQIIGAEKQGMTMLSETFAQYSALLVMEKLYGKEQIRKFLKGELDRYLRSRGGEVVEELPLYKVENQQYVHYQKGSLVMYWLKEVVGEEVVNRALSKLLAEYAFKPAPYPSSVDFLRILRAEAGPQHDALITDLFEKITLYDVKATDAKAKQRPDGKFTLTFSVESYKMYADGKGKEEKAPLDEVFEVGAFTAEPGRKGYTTDAVLKVDRVQLRSGKQQIEMIVDQPPKFVGVDPFNKRIDRNSDDNLTKVEMQ